MVQHQYTEWYCQRKKNKYHNPSKIEKQGGGASIKKRTSFDKKDYWQNELKSLGIEPDHLKNQPKVEEEELRAFAESIKSVYYQAYKAAYSGSSNSNGNNNIIG